MKLNIPQYNNYYNVVKHIYNTIFHRSNVKQINIDTYGYNKYINGSSLFYNIDIDLTFNEIDKVLIYLIKNKLIQVRSKSNILDTVFYGRITISNNHILNFKTIYIDDYYYIPTLDNCYPHKFEDYFTWEPKL